MCYAKGKYYITCSTFQYYPGISLYETEDFLTINQIPSPLNVMNKFSLKGIDDSAGIWAPNLVYYNNEFYLSYTIVKSATGVYYDMDNYIIKSKSIEGPWTEPARVNSGCFDPSLFFDKGKLYLFAKIVDHRYEMENDYIENYSGIIRQELNPNTFEQIGDYRIVTYGTELGGEEGPQMFKRNGYYYLNIAEGGTEYNHQTTILRSKSIDGPFEVHPNNPMLKSNFSSELKKAGHASFIKNDDNNWLISHLCSRPITFHELEGSYCPLGRETAIQNIHWKDDWPYIDGGQEPQNYFKFGNTSKEKGMTTISYKKTRKYLDDSWLSLRQEINKWNIETTDSIVMRGKDSLMSKFDVNMYLKRVETLNCTLSANIGFCPNDYLQTAGISLYYDTENFLSLFITHDLKYGKCVKIEALKHGKYSTFKMNPIPVDNESIGLRLRVNLGEIECWYKERDIWKNTGVKYNAAFLSDDFIQQNNSSFFTGMMFGIYTTDLSGLDKHATFKDVEVYNHF